MNPSKPESSAFSFFKPYLYTFAKSDEYSGRLEEPELPEEVRLLIDRYVSEQNALGSRYRMHAYLLVFGTICEVLLLWCFTINLAVCGVQ
ncbi:MAG: hypothetical protein K2O32_12390 [Acetatifactor sp.]|nr:hypothetical protein [Acetatifactor sp.]